MYEYTYMYISFPPWKALFFLGNTKFKPQTLKNKGKLSSLGATAVASGWMTIDAVATNVVQEQRNWAFNTFF